MLVPLLDCGLWVSVCFEVENVSIMSGLPRNDAHMSLWSWYNHLVVPFVEGGGGSTMANLVTPSVSVVIAVYEISTPQVFQIPECSELVQGWVSADAKTMVFSSAGRGLYPDSANHTILSSDCTPHSSAGFGIQQIGKTNHGTAFRDGLLPLVGVIMVGVSPATLILHLACFSSPCRWLLQSGSKSWVHLSMLSNFLTWSALGIMWRCFQRPFSLYISYNFTVTYISVPNH